MITDRKWPMGGKDQPLSKQEAQVLERKIEEEKRREKCRKELKENMLSHKDTAQLNIYKQPQDDIMQSQIADIVSLCKDLKKHQFRDDYKELMELTMVYIGAKMTKK